MSGEGVTTEKARRIEQRPWRPEDGDTRCQDCGRANPVWFAPNGLWNRVMGGPECTSDPGGTVCPLCFAARAEEAGIVPTAWQFGPETHRTIAAAERGNAQVGRCPGCHRPSTDAPCVGELCPLRVPPAPPAEAIPDRVADAILGLVEHDRAMRTPPAGGEDRG